MSYSPIAYTLPQYENYPNWWFKAYEQGTTTPLAISYDSAGATLVAKVELDAEGFPLTAGGDRFIPFLSGFYDLWLFPTAAEADADDTTNAIQFADNINSNPLTADITLNTVTDTVNLSSGQTVVTFTYDVNSASFYITGSDADNGRLLKNTDFTITDAAAREITLSQSYPAGTSITQAFNQEGTNTPADDVPFDTVAQLKLSSTVAGLTAYTKGYTTAGDGGQAEYLIKSAAQAATDGDVIDGYGNHTIANGNVAILQHSGVLNIAQFGAVADGVTNAAPSINACVALVESGDASEIYIPDGDFFVSPASGTTCVMWSTPSSDWQINPRNVVVCGNGENSRILVDNASANNVFMSGPSLSGSTDFVDGIMFRDFRIESKTVSGLDRYTTMTNYGRAFNVARMRRCTFENMNFYAVQPFFQKASGEDSNNNYVQQIRIKNCGSVGHQAGFVNFDNPAYSCTIEENNIEAGNLGIRIGSSSGQSSFQLSILKNTIQSNGGTFCGIRLNWTSACNIVGNYFESNRASAGVATPQLVINNNADSSSIVIDSNLFGQGLTAVDGYGAPFYHVRLDEVSDTIVMRGNTFTGGNGVELTSTSTGHVVVLNSRMNTVGSIYSEGDIVTTGATGAKSSTELPVYEPLGTWTPVISDAETGGNTATATISRNRYVRVGDMVTVTCNLININTAGMTAGNTLYIQGLPYAANSNVAMQGSCILEQVTFTDMVVPYVFAGDQVIQLRQTTTAGNDSSLTVAALTSGTADILLTMTYFV